MAQDDRLIQNRPTALTRLVNKYGTGRGAIDLSGFQPSTVAGIRALDVQRANMGQNPFTSLETQLGATATDQRAPVIPEPKAPSGLGGFLSNAADNIQTIVSEVPKLPITLFREVQQLPNLPEQVGPALDRGGNPVEDLGNLAQLPGLRLIPGSFIASQFGTGGAGVSGLVENPVLTALDALPYAEKAARLTPTYKAAVDAAERARPLLADTGVPLRTPPIRTVVENLRRGGPVETTAKFGNIEYPTLEPNAVGRGIDLMAERLKNTTPGDWATRAFGREARATTAAMHRSTADAATGNFLPDASVNQEMVAKAFKLTEDANQLAKEFSDIPPDVQARIAETIQVGAPGYQKVLENLSPRAREFANRFKEMQDPYAEALVDASPDLTRVDFNGTSEIYDTPTATRITKARHAVDEQLATAKLRAHLDTRSDFTAPVDEILADARTAMADTSIPVKRRSALARGYIQALDNAGVDVSSLRRGQNLTAEYLSKMFDDVEIPDRALSVNKARVVEAAQQLRRAARTDGKVGTFVDAITRKNPDWARARELAVELQRRKVFRPDIDLPEVAFELRRLRQSDLANARLQAAGYTDSAFNRATRVRDLAESAPPARFQSAVLSKLDEMVRNYLTDNYSGSQLDTLLDKATYRLYDDPTMVDAVPDMAKFKKEARRSWLELRDQGYDPQFVHHVTPQRAQSLKFPRITDSTPSLSQTKARLWDAGPQTTDLALTLNARGMEYLIQQGSRSWVYDYIVPAWTKPLSELRAELHDAAVTRLEQNPAKNYQAHMADLVNREWKPFDPEAFINPRSPRIGANPENTLMIPKVVADTIERLRPTPSELGKLTDPAMKVFRTSLLPLSPRWHVYNVIGGAVMLGLRSENPLMLWKYMREARRMASEGGPGAVLREADDLSLAEMKAGRTAPPSTGRASGEYLRDLDSTNYKALHDYMAGRTLKRLWDSASVKRTLRDPFNTIVEKSYGFNEWVDDFYKSMAYLEGSDRALTKGLTREQSIVKGIEASRQILQNWDTLTPLERSAMRFLMPFYGWTRTLLKYTLTYPSDHPWRMSIISNFARAEMTDQNLGLPQRLRDLLFIGDVDANGNQQAINLSGMNPFRDIASYFTLAGFIGSGEGDIGVLTSQMNPAISTVLQWAGVDPSSGSPELYPDMRYDPTTGQLVVAPRENPGLTAIGNLLPQTRLFTSLTGMSNQFKELAARDPKAAGRMLASSAGIPVLNRTVNVPQEVTKAEAQRLKYMREQLNAALKSGDTSTFGAMYPTLRTLVDKIKTGDTTNMTPDPTIKGGGGGDPWAVIAGALQSAVPGL